MKPKPSSTEIQGTSYSVTRTHWHHSAGSVDFRSAPSSPSTETQNKETFKQNSFMICKWDPHNSDPHTDEETIPYNSFRYAHDSHVLLIHLQMFLANIIVCSLTSRICCDLLTGRSCKHTQEMCSWYFCLSTAAQYSSAHALQKPSRLRTDVFWADALLFYIRLHFFNIIFS